MSSFEISGKVVETETGEPVAGVVISVFDKDLVFDEELGQVYSDSQGNFRLEYERNRFRNLFDRLPDIYITVKSASGNVLYTTKEAVRFNASPQEQFQLKIPADVLRRNAVPVGKPAAPKPFMKMLTCLPDHDEDELAEAIRSDSESSASLLEMIRGYMADLEGSCDNQALPLQKLQKLFELGRTIEGLEGHHYGVAVGLRTGDLSGVAVEFGNFLGWIWGAAIGRVSPWVGKTFAPISSEDSRKILGDAEPRDAAVYKGFNHFNVIESAPINLASNAALTFMWNLQEVSEEERARYGHERNGGFFVAHKAPSVWSQTPREVLSLNYRHTALGNVPPLAFLIDELVEIAEGLYLGQLLFATKRLLKRYDPARENESGYQNFGYFLLFDEKWNAEARRLFPHLDIPPGDFPQPAEAVPDIVEGWRSKFTTLTLSDSARADLDPTILGQVEQDAAGAGNIMQMLKAYSDQLRIDRSTQSPVFRKLHNLFNAGIGPERMDGFYRGALIAWQSQGLLAAFDLNTINIMWQATRTFSPWTGKHFFPIEKDRLLELTDNHETMAVPTFFCANTVVFRTRRERFTRRIMRLAGIWMEDATTEEKHRHGYDAKTFFFIGKPAASVLPENRGKSVFQFNYRWKALRNPIPDCYCIDELVQIADGLYLGQVFYATDWIRPWNPATDTSEYRYQLFEYFLLMDEEWHALRLKIGFDLENI